MSFVLFALLVVFSGACKGPPKVIQPNVQAGTERQNGDDQVLEPAKPQPGAKGPRDPSLLWPSTQTLKLDGSTSAARQVRAVWITHHVYEDQSFDADAIASQLAAATFNTAYVAVYSGGTPKWDSQSYREAGGKVDKSDNLLRLVEALRRRKIIVGAWFEYGLALYPRNHEIAVAHPDWLQRTKEGATGGNEPQVFLSPTHPKVMALMQAMVQELAEMDIFNEIQLDRLRYTRESSEGREFGYEAVALEKYRATQKSTATPNKDDPSWVRFRETEVNALVKACYEAIKAASPTTLVSIAPVGHYGIQQHAQRWTDWIAGGYIDAIAIQVYNLGLAAFQNHLERQLQELEASLTQQFKNRLIIGIRAQDDDDSLQSFGSIDYLAKKGLFNTAFWAFHKFNGSSAYGIDDDVKLLKNPAARSETQQFASFRGWQNRPIHPFIEGLD